MKRGMTAIAALALSVVVSGQLAMAQPNRQPERNAGKKIILRQEGENRRVGTRLNLTERQRARARDIFARAEKKSMNVLDAKQRKALQERRAAWKKDRRTPGQKTNYGRKTGPGAKGEYGRKVGPGERGEYGREVGPDKRGEYGRKVGPGERGEYGRKAVMDRPRQNMQGRDVFQGLKLSASQQARIAAIRKNARAEFRSILTADQKKVFDRMGANNQHKGNHRR